MNGIIARELFTQHQNEKSVFNSRHALPVRQKVIFKARTIPPAHLAHSMIEGRRLAPNQISDAMLDTYVNKLRQIDQWNDDALKPTRDFARLIYRNVTTFGTEVTLARLAENSVFIVPLSYCGAYTEAPDTIVIGSGFIDYLAAYLFWGAVIHELPDELSRLTHPDYPTIPLRDLIPLLLIALLYRYLHHGEPLPNYRALLSESRDELVLHSLAGGLTFVLFHELGHLVLNHHEENQEVRLVNLPFQVPEALSTYKLQELEADSFARKALIEDYRPIQMFWMRAALGAHLLFETLVSSKGEDHPIGINRFVHAQHSSDDAVDRSAYLEGLGLTVQQYQSLEAKNQTLGSSGHYSLLEQFTGERIRSLLHEINPHTKRYGIDLMLATNTEMPDWRTLFASDAPQ